LNIPAWPKLRHRRQCVVCGKPFTVVGGRASQLSYDLSTEAPGDSSWATQCVPPIVDL